MLKLIGFQGLGRKGKRLVGAPVKKKKIRERERDTERDQTEFTLKIFPFYNGLFWHLNVK